jgi:5'-nucleotidase (lipoprotein e(P4) family)
LLWFQSSAEAQALFYQAYQLARHRLDEELRQAHAAPPALVIDIDETILDNSPHQAKLIATSEVFPAYWDEWVNRAEALPLPGALGFLQFADSSGVAIFYLSNRDERMLEATMRNLVGHGFPQLSRDRFLLRSEESSKKGRRAQISERFDILLLIGDNLNDFSEIFEQKDPAERRAAAEQLRAQFGRKFIVLPNPYYGDWENAAFGHQRGLSVAQKNRKRIEALQAF